MPVEEITIDQVNGLPLVMAEPIFKTEAALKAVGAFLDAAGNTLRADTFLLGNNTVVLAQKIGPDGTVLDRKRVDCPDPQKFDLASCWPKGTSMMIGSVSHDSRPINPRDSYGWVAEIEGWVTVAPPVPVPTPNPEPPTPCVLPGNRDYFKPNNPFTRAQAMKVIAIMAAGSADAVPDTTTQTFEDVPVGSTFHKFIEYVFGEGAINGYDCTPE